VNAVEYGRGLYDNLLKYLRFQMSTLVAYIAIFLLAGALNIAAGAPLNPIQILWLNMVIDIPIAIALGFDEPTPGLMKRKPRPVGAPVLSATDWVRLCIQGAIMTAGSLIAYQIGHDHGPVVASTMLLTTLSLFHLFGGLLARNQRETMFRKEAIPGRVQLRRYGIAIVLIIAVTGIDFLNRIVTTTDMNFQQWSTCVGIAASLIVVEEVIKFFIRRRAHEDAAAIVRPAEAPAAIAA
jgi:Ca2+-transporting ATPase